MTNDPNNVTAYPAVNAMLTLLHTEVQRILGENFVGMYLYGSLTGDQFDPDSSDIDFLVVVEQEVRGQPLDDLVRMHQTLYDTASSKWAKELEASYIPRAALRRYDPAHIHHPHIDRGGSVLSVEQHDVDWIVQRYVLRQQGIVISGPPLTTLIDPITPDELRQALTTLMAIWWEPMSRNPVQLQQDGYRSYAVLSMCRILYTFEYGTVASKTKAAQWAAAKLDAEWTSLIKQAAQARHGTKTITIEQVCAFIRDTDRRIRAYWSAQQAD